MQAYHIAESEPLVLDTRLDILTAALQAIADMGNSAPITFTDFAGRTAVAGRQPAAGTMRAIARVALEQAAAVEAALDVQLERSLDLDNTPRIIADMEAGKDYYR